MTREDVAKANQLLDKNQAKVANSNIMIYNVYHKEAYYEYHDFKMGK